jgi:putative tryptophan/tyrosine transport system substrate-binding protein
MDRRTACLALVAGSSFATVLARAQSTRAARIAWVSINRADPDSPFLVSFRSGMRSLGWVEGRNVVLDTWWAGGSIERLRALIPEIVASQPDVIVAAGGQAARSLIDARTSIPFVFAISADAVIGRVVDSWARPGGNRTGISLFSLELTPKRLALMKEAIPGMKCVAMVGWPQHSGEALELEAARTAAERSGLLHHYFGVSTVAELDAALEAIALWKADAILVFAGGVASENASRVAAFATRKRIPAVSAWAVFAEEGNLMTYGPVLKDSYERLATFVDRILKGADPANMPVERPTKFELVINVKAAKALGVDIPRPVLLRADRVIE